MVVFSLIAIFNFFLECNDTALIMIGQKIGWNDIAGLEDAKRIITEVRITSLSCTCIAIKRTMAFVST